MTGVRGSPSRCRSPARRAIPIQAGLPGALRARPGASASPTRIVVVDDDPMALRFVRDALVTSGYSVVATGNPLELSRLIRTEKPKLVLLDLMLPGTGGMELMERVPELAEGIVPVIFVSAYGGEETVAEGARDGRCRLRRQALFADRAHSAGTGGSSKAGRARTLHAGRPRHRLRGSTGDLAGTPVKLTATEFELLRIFSLNAGRVLTYDALLRQVWGGQTSGSVEVVRTFVKRLRERLHDHAANPVYIHTERGVGYRMPRADEG